MTIPTVNELFIHTQPAHLQKLMGAPLDGEERNAARARTSAAGSARRGASELTHRIRLLPLASGVSPLLLSQQGAHAPRSPAEPASTPLVGLAAIPSLRV